MRGPVTGFRGHLITAIAAAAATSAFVVYLLVAAGAVSIGQHRYHVRAVLPTSAAIAPRSRVTMAGVEVGDVESVQRLGTGAVVEMAIDKHHSPIPIDTTATIRLRTLVGEKSIELTPGRSTRRLEDGGTLPLNQSANYVEVDQILSQLRGATRQRARQALQSLGRAVGERGPELNRLLEGTAGMINTGAPVVHDLALERAQISRLVTNLGDIAAQVGDRGAALRTLAAQMTTTFAAIADRDAALRAAIDQLPATLDQLRRTSGTLRLTSAVVSPVLGRLTSAVDGLRPSVQLLRPAAQDGAEVVARLGAAAPPLGRTLAALERFSPPASAVLPKIRSVLCQFDPLARYLAPYAGELTSVITGLGSAVNAYDANGHIARLYIGVGPNSLIGVPPGVSRAESELLRAGILHQVHLLGYNPYPAAGAASGTAVGRNSIGPADAQNKYVRVEGAC